MKGKKILKSIISTLCLILVMTAINMSIKVAMEGMWLLGIPKPEDVTSVTIKYPSLTEDDLEITDEEQIDTCVRLSGFLKYRPFASTEVATGKEEVPITLVYHVSDGKDVEVSANSTFVFYKGKKHVLKDDDSFVTFINVLFYQENDAPIGTVGSNEEDVCELYFEVLENLWNIDPGLNSDISKIGIDLSALSGLSEAEKDYIMDRFSSKHDLPYIKGTWEELCEQGYIDKENLYWKDGLFFQIKTIENDPALKSISFDAHKWRSGLGAYFFGNCTATKDANGKWTYTIGQEAIS